MELKNKDDELMMQVKSGNLNSLAPLFEKYHVRLYNFFFRLTRQKELSEDLVQEVFQRILKYRKSYDHQRSFYTWMFQIARNSLNRHYKLNRLHFNEIDDDETIVKEHFVENEIETKTDDSLLYDALNRLPPKDREVIELSRFQGMKYKEIANLTDNSVVAIKVQIHRAIKRLREVYFELAK